MAEEVMNTTQRIQDGIESMPGLKIIGKPVMCVFSFTSDRHDIYLVGDELAARRMEPRQAAVPSCPAYDRLKFDNTGP